MRVLMAATTAIPIPAPGECVLLGRRARLFPSLAVLTLLLGASSSRAAGAEEPPCALETAGTHTVVRVIDAETIALDDGSEARLIGALPPSRSDGPYGADLEGRARAALEGLVLGRQVELRTGGRSRDRYGRHLAHVFIPGGDKSVWVQGQLLEAGHARAYALPGNDACLGAMLEKEGQGRRNSRELWFNSSYSAHRSDEVQELLALRGRFALVEGKVWSVAERGGRVYLNFGRDWRRDFTASAPPRLLRRNAEGAKRLSGLQGRLVRVRGWLERRNGPLIEIASLDDIEVIDGVDAAGSSQAGATAERSPQN